MRQKPAIIWFTGLSGAAKSTISNIVKQQLHAAGHHTMLLDGDNIRHGLCRVLGFTEADRVENIRRVGEVAKLIPNADLLSSARSSPRIAPSATWCAIGLAWRVHRSLRRHADR
jgi:adenylylsulfate kinase-like enzyme